MQLEAPAKINLGLRVLGRREDGYHLLDSVFVPVALADTVELEATGPPGPVELSVAGAPEALVPSDARNLALRAAEAFRDAAGLDVGLRIRLAKRIPAQAGLGGGSSDAGAVLRGLAEAHPGRVAPERLAALALGLGADVPFFLDPRPARVTGIGEGREPLLGLLSWPLVLARSGPPLATADVFAGYDEGPSLTPPGSDPTIRALQALREPRGPSRAADALRALLHNDLEPAATALNPAVATLQREIEQEGALAAAMSGSGPTVYGLFEDEGHAAQAAERLQAQHGAETWVTRTLPSPPA